MEQHSWKFFKLPFISSQMSAIKSLPFFMEPLHILGSGSIGMLWATSLRSAFPSYPLAVLMREHHREAIQEEKEITICLRKDRKRPIMAQVPVQFITDVNLKSIKTLILSTKAFQAVDAVNSVLPRLQKEKPTIAILSNGALDVRENLLELLSTNAIQEPHLIMCTTTNGVYQESPDDDMFHLVQTGIGRTYLGKAHTNKDDDDERRSESVPRIAELWDRAGLNAKAIDSSEMEILLWKKLAANCVCNPLTSLHDCTNGQLVSELPSFTSTREQVVKEVSQVARALCPELEMHLNFEALNEFVEITIQDNLQNTSSMHRDVHQKRHQRTEIENLNGFIVRKSAQLNLDCPANEELLHKVSVLTKETC
eukprot:scaffold3467_cov118-Cylindrotheca_fusiformis.AAC.4